MTEPFLGEIRLMAFNSPPQGWALCNGQLMVISQNTALFSLLGTTYGGDGKNNFALPNLQGRVPLHVGRGGDGVLYTLGQFGGAEAVTLTADQLPQHGHTFFGTTPSGAVERPPTGGALLGKPASGSNNYYAADSNALQPLYPTSMTHAPGGSLPHNNMQPFLAMSFCIALFGVFPTSN